MNTSKGVSQRPRIKRDASPAFVIWLAIRLDHSDDRLTVDDQSAKAREVERKVR